MSDEIKNPENEAPKSESVAELPEAELDQVTGGKVDYNPIKFTKPVDKSTP